MYKVSLKLIKILVINTGFVFGWFLNEPIIKLLLMLVRKWTFKSVSALKTDKKVKIELACRRQLDFHFSSLAQKVIKMVAKTPPFPSPWATKSPKSAPWGHQMGPKCQKASHWKINEKNTFQKTPKKSEKVPK